MNHLTRSTMIALIVLAGGQIAAAASAEPVLTNADDRWRSLPDTRTSFVPKHYNTREEWEARHVHLKKQILWSAGLSPIPERTPLEARIFDRIDRGDYTVEKVSFQSAHGLFVCGNLYRPKNPSPRGHPGILNPHGHAKTGRLHDDDIASYQARCITYARMGGVAFMWDMVDYNDSAMQLNGRYEDETYVGVHKSSWNQRRNRRTLWNVNSLGIQLWNSIRALDFLESLPEVDPNRLASTGESGGGTQTFLLGAVDDRLKVGAPVCMVSAFMQGGCTCENAPGLRYDTHNVEFGAMMAPRPLMLVSVTKDWTQHTETVELPAIRSVYKALGAESNLAHAHFDARHRYNLAMRNAVYPWMAKEVSVRLPATFKEPPYQPEKAEDLLAFKRAVPDTAVRDHETLVDRIIAQARAPWHNSSAAAARVWSRPAENREIYGEGLRLSVGMRPIGRKDVSYERGASITLSSAPQ
jgi:dienelactone hydrolase